MHYIVFMVVHQKRVGQAVVYKLCKSAIVSQYKVISITCILHEHYYCRVLLLYKKEELRIIIIWITYYYEQLY